MNDNNEAIELHVDQGVMLRTAFVWREDRFAHVVSIVDPYGEHCLLDSVEGDPTDAWPPSPALQQLTMHGQGEQRVALLVGMAGRSHWSMSVELVKPQRRMVFDVACRMNETAERLGSCYRINGEFKMADDSITGQAGKYQFRLALAETPDGAEQSIAATSTEAQILCHSVQQTTPVTSRWKYIVELPEKGAM